MKTNVILAAAMFTLWTVVNPGTAQAAEGSLSTTFEDSGARRLRDLPVHINTQLGLSSFERSGSAQGDAKQKLSGALTFEFGGSQRRMETGLLFLQSGSMAKLPKTTEETALESTYLAIPMAAKIRLLSMKAQAWYLKFGFMSAFELSSNHNSATNDMDVIGVLGLSGRLAAPGKSNLVVEATYNRGLIDSLRGDGRNYHQGFLILAGLSFPL